MAAKELISSHYLQSAPWASLRSAFGWQVIELDLQNKLLHAYRKPTLFGGIVYIPGFMPRTPDDLSTITAQLKGNLVCKLEPCQESDQKVSDMFDLAGWRPARHVQYEHTVLIDLTLTYDNLWKSLKARGRQEINYALKAGVSVVAVEPTSKNFEIMYDLLHGTSRRKAFGIREHEVVLRYWSAFKTAGKLKLYFAYHNDEVIAGGIFITDGKQRIWYKDAGSLPGYAKMFAPRLLLWQAARDFKKQGYRTFDLGGIPAPDNYQQSPMRGIYVFKTAFSRRITTMMPAYELPLRPVLYPFWRSLEPTALRMRRKVSAFAGMVRSR